LKKVVNALYLDSEGILEVDVSYQQQIQEEVKEKLEIIEKQEEKVIKMTEQEKIQNQKHIASIIQNAHLPSLLDLDTQKERIISQINDCNKKILFWEDEIQYLDVQLNSLTAQPSVASTDTTKKHHEEIKKIQPASIPNDMIFPVQILGSVFLKLRQQISRYYELINEFNLLHNTMFTFMSKLVEDPTQELVVEYKQCSSILNPLLEK